MQLVRAREFKKIKDGLAAVKASRIAPFDPLNIGKGAAKGAAATAKGAAAKDANGAKGTKGTLGFPVFTLFMADLPAV